MTDLVKRLREVVASGIYPAWENCELLEEAAERIEELESALRTISESEPVGDGEYKYGYAWEFCVMTASRALLEDSDERLENIQRDAHETRHRYE